MRISHQKQQMGWKSSANRPQCGNCQHCVERAVNSAYVISTIFCLKGNFDTTKQAVCDEWVVKA